MAKNNITNNRDIGYQPGEKAPPIQTGKSWFLGIGIDNYQGFQPLNNAVKDVQDIRDILIEKYDFEASNTELLCNELATRENIIEKLIELRQLPPEDKLLIYYSGHGYVFGKEKAQKGYWIPVDAKKDKLSGYIDNSIIKDWIQVYQVRHLLLISDSCFSESLITREATKGIFGAYPQWAAERSRYIFSSGKGVVSDGDPGKNSPFASQIINSLKKHAEIIDIVALADEVTKTVSWDYEQKADCSPIFQAGHQGGRYLFIPKLSISQEDSDWKKASEENTIDSYHNFIEQYSGKGLYYKTAKAALEILEEEEFWNKTQSRHNRSAYFNYLEQYPNGKFKADAKKALNNFKKKPTIDTISAEFLPTKPETVKEKPALSMVQPKKTLSIEPEMVFVKGGTFLMGKEEKKQGHEVTLDDFYIGKYQVTQAEWKAVMGDNPSDFKGDELPVDNVSWSDTLRFVQILNEKTGKKYRLPTEAEWEYAARGGELSKGYRYSGSNNIEEVAWFWDNSSDKKLKGTWISKMTTNINSKTHPVGQLKANELGIFDMSGNVWEWCMDWYGVYPTTPQINPLGPSTGTLCVIRGGSWYSFADNCRVTNRDYYLPAAGYNRTGFRLLRTE